MCPGGTDVAGTARMGMAMIGILRVFNLILFSTTLKGQS